MPILAHKPQAVPEPQQSVAILHRTHETACTKTRHPQHLATLATRATAISVPTVAMVSVVHVTLTWNLRHAPATHQHHTAHNGRATMVYLAAGRQAHTWKTFSTTTVPVLGKDPECTRFHPRQKMRNVCLSVFMHSGVLLTGYRRGFLHACLASRVKSVSERKTLTI